MMLTTLADIARTSGLRVVELDGWQRRGHGALQTVETILVHHTAGPVAGNMPSLRVVTDGRPGLSGPLCNLGLARDGTVYVVAAGVAYHAGSVTRTAYDNWHAIGIEAEASGTGLWPATQMDAYARLCAALCRGYRLPFSRVLGHKEVCKPRGRKIDPNFDMTRFRAAVLATTNTGDDMAYTDWPKKDRDALAADVVAAFLKAGVANKNPSGKTTPGSVAGMLTNIEVGGDAIQQQLNRIEALLKGGN